MTSRRPLGTAALSVSLGWPTLTLALRQGAGLSRWVTSFPLAGVFPFSSHTCLEREAHSCCPVSPFSLLARRVCCACDLPPRPLVFSLTHSLLRTAPAGGLPPSAPRCCYRCRTHRCYRCKRVIALWCYRCHTFAAQAQQKMAGHLLGFVRLTARQCAFSLRSAGTARHGLFVRVFVQVPSPRLLGWAWYYCTLAMLNIEPPEPKNSGSNADDPINLAHLLGMLHLVDLIC
jgi:hypothetical protein